MVEWHQSDELSVYSNCDLQPCLRHSAILILDTLHLAAYASTEFVRSFKDTLAEGEFPEAVISHIYSRNAKAVTQKVFLLLKAQSH